MSRKYFMQMAAIISHIESVSDRIYVAKAFADMCHDNNDRFDRQKFYAACKLP